MRLQQKLILLTTFSIFLFVAFSSVYYARKQEDKELKNLYDRSAALIKVLSIASSTQLFWGNYDRLNQYTRKIKETLPVKFVSIVDQGGKIMAHTDRERIGQLISFPKDFRVLASKDVESLYKSGPKSSYTISYPIFILDKIVGFMILQYDTTSIENEIEGIFIDSITFALILGIIGVIISVYTSYRIAKPLQVVVDGMERIASGDLDHKIRIDDHTVEVSRLAQTFNNMGHKLQATIQKLDREKSQSEAIITSMSDGLMLIDTDRRVRFLNKGAEDILGFDSEEARGKACSDIFRSPQCGEENCSLFCNTSMEGANAKTEEDAHVVITNKDGRNISLLKSTSPLVNPHGEVYGGVEVFKDITNMMAMETKLKEADRLASIGILAAGMAHEINNPIAGIIGLANALIRDFSGNKVLAEDLTIIKEQGQRCGHIIKNLMKLAVNAPKELTLIDINSLVRQTTNIVIRSMPSSAMTIKEAYDPASPTLYADEGQLMQVFTNILRNAVTATSEKGVLNIATFARDGVVEITFEDNGAGIKKADLGKVFDSFFTTKKSGEGIGLGLAVSQGIILNHGGDINIVSEVGKGTTFKVTLISATAINDDYPDAVTSSIEEKSIVN